MEIKVMRLAELNAAEYNPRKKLKPGDNEYEKLKNSILTFGNVEPIIWNKRTGNIVGGHQRVTVLLDLGIAESEVSVVDMPIEREKALNVALNKIGGDWDMEKLCVLLPEISLEMDVTITGFDLNEVEELTTQDDISDEPAEAIATASNFRYREQYGVIVICESEDDQTQIYSKLSEQGYVCKVVAT